MPTTVQATVENGWVTLTGSVTWEYQRNSAEDSVRYLPGVKGVSNNVTLKPSVQPTAIKVAIEKALKRDAEIDAEEHGRVGRRWQSDPRRYGHFLG